MKYGESIYTKRWELLGAYELTDENIVFVLQYQTMRIQFYGDITHLKHNNALVLDN
jgi:hypothetical protein